MPETLPALTSSHPTAVLAQRWVNGELIATMAAEHGVTPQAIYARIQKWAMSSQGDVDYAALKEAVQVNKIIESDEELKNARDQVEIARARERCKFARWDAERRCPKTFGLKQSDSNDKIVVIVQRNAENNGNNTQTIDVSPCNESEGNKIESLVRPI